MILFFIIFLIIVLLIISMGYNIKIVNLTFKDIPNGVRIRLENNTLRNHTIQDIENRIYWALKDTNDYRELLEKYAWISICTDEYEKEETYEKVCLDLRLKRNKYEE